MKRLVAVLLLAVVLIGCARGDATGITQERFVDVMVALRQAAEETGGDAASYAARRDQILGEAGVSEEDLRSYVETHGRDLEHMARVWESVNARLGEPLLVEPDTL